MFHTHVAKVCLDGEMSAEPHAPGAVSCKLLVLQEFDAAVRAAVFHAAPRVASQHTAAPTAFAWSWVFPASAVGQCVRHAEMLDDALQALAQQTEHLLGLAGARAFPLLTHLLEEAVARLALLESPHLGLAGGVDVRRCGAYLDADG
jgi:hypothetical protein